MMSLGGGREVEKEEGGEREVVEEEGGGRREALSEASSSHLRGVLN